MLLTQVAVPEKVNVAQSAGNAGAITPSKFSVKTEAGGGGGTGMVSVRTSSTCQ